MPSKPGGRAFIFGHMSKDLQGKIALVTGGTRGIGLGIVRTFAAQGADVAFTYKSSAELARELENELKELGVRAKGYASDASDFQEAGHLIDSVLLDFGNLELVVNNAGITRDQLLLRMTEDHWDQVLNNNLKSVFNICKHAARPLMKNRKGSIINISSVVGRSGNAGQSNYAASKAGVIGLTQSLARELGSRNIRCNAVAPGFILTEMTGHLDPAVAADWNARIPLGRVGSVQEVADVVAFLASDRASYVTGQCWNVCGGMDLA